MDLKGIEFGGHAFLTLLLSHLCKMMLVYFDFHKFQASMCQQILTGIKAGMLEYRGILPGVAVGLFWGSIGREMKESFALYSV